MVNYDLMDNFLYLGVGGVINVEVEDDLFGNMLEICIDDIVFLSD